MTQKYATVQGSYMPIGDIDKGTLPPGTFRYLIDNTDGHVDAMEYVCPCGCNVVCCLPFLACTQPFINGEGKPLYEWNGNYERPTIEQAICDIDENGPHWRGRITDGVFVGGNKDDG